jgi:cbb3-type cytochrome oxidase subunit 1
VLELAQLFPLEEQMTFWEFAHVHADGFGGLAFMAMMLAFAIFLMTPRRSQ